MRILWSVNLIPANVSNVLDLSSEVLGGWVEAMSSQLNTYSDIELAVACKCDENINFNLSVNGVKFYSLPYSSKTSANILEKKCTKIIEDFKPDVIHIEGTEFLHAKAMLAAADNLNIPAVASMQGILNGQYNYQCGDLQIDDMMFSCSLTNVFAAWILHLRKTRWFKPRMKTEKEVISKAKYILGRTTWDRAHSYALNKFAKYYSCPRNLRTPFYEYNWNIENIERHSIYIGNSYSALKGFHFLVQAVALLKDEYPDMKIYVAGYKPYESNDNRSFLKKGYAAYLKKLINDLNVNDHIIFTGPLKADDVADKLSKVNVYTLCSAVENSPNTLGEAMLVGTPCIAAYVGGVSDMAEDGKEALFYRNNDAALLAWCIKQIFDNDELALKLSENGKAKAHITHDVVKNAATLRDVYIDILKATEVNL